MMCLPTSYNTRDTPIKKTVNTRDQTDKVNIYCEIGAWYVCQHYSTQHKETKQRKKPKQTDDVNEWC